MNKIAFGQYYHTDSFIHRLDPRTKIISLILMMVFIFVIPKNQFVVLGFSVALLLAVVFLTKVPLIRYLKSLKQIMFLLIFSFFFQALFNNSGDLLLTINQNISIANIALGVVLIVLYLFFRKYLPLKFLWLILLVISIIYIFQYPIIGQSLKSYQLKVYRDGVVTGFFIIVRIMLLIVFSSILTLTTKPTDLNNALEWLMRPLEWVKIPTSVLAMMISISLRFIPTLFLETERILKAQASRGVDFKEGKVKAKITQIISLLIPMFIISFKRAFDLADAMEARGYIPGAKRTKLALLKFGLSDYFVLIFALGIVIGLIVLRVNHAL
ncbi:MAG: energy-coupling factor transporter transmembrane component T [Bacilli bacterium]